MTGSFPARLGEAGRQAHLPGVRRAHRFGVPCSEGAFDLAAPWPEPARRSRQPGSTTPGCREQSDSRQGSNGTWSQHRTDDWVDGTGRWLQLCRLNRNER
jgi:hypothetical protein